MRKAGRVYRRLVFHAQRHILGMIGTVFATEAASLQLSLCDSALSSHIIGYVLWNT
jgi:hypothetical protein